MQKHFVTFYSPGTFFNETTTKPIDSWDVDKAVEMSKSISERHGAKPFAFRFITKGRGDEDLDSRVIEESYRYFLGGRVRTYEEVLADNKDDERILRTNMKSNNIKAIVESTPEMKNWKWTQTLEEGDEVLSAER